MYFPTTVIQDQWWVSSLEPHLASSASLALLHGLLGPDGPALVRRQHKGSVAVQHDAAVGGGCYPEVHRVEVGLQPHRDCLPIRSLSSADEVDVHPTPDPGDRTDPPDGRLLGGTGGRSSARSHTLGLATSSTATTIQGELAGAAEFPQPRPRASAGRPSTPPGRDRTSPLPPPLRQRPGRGRAPSSEWSVAQMRWWILGRSSRTCAHPRESQSYERSPRANPCRRRAPYLAGRRCCTYQLSNTPCLRSQFPDRTSLSKR